MIANAAAGGWEDKTLKREPNFSSEFGGKIHLFANIIDVISITDTATTVRSQKTSFIRLQKSQNLILTLTSNEEVVRSGILFPSGCLFYVSCPVSHKLGSLIHFLKLLSISQNIIFLCGVNEMVGWVIEYGFYLSRRINVILYRRFVKRIFSLFRFLWNFSSPLR